MNELLGFFTTLVTQTGVIIDFDSVPWWLPGTIVVTGLFLYGVPHVDKFISIRLKEWQQLPHFARWPVIAIFVGGAGLIVFTQLEQHDWMYVLFLFGYARAVEGVTILHLFGRLNDIARKVANGEGDNGSKLRKFGKWVLFRIRKRLLLILTTTLLLVLSMGLLIAILVAFPETPVTVRVAGVVTVTTFALSTVNATWTLSKVTEEIGPGAFIGVICCVVGGELYNLPAALSLFNGIPAVEGPIGPWTTIIVGAIGWGVGLILSVMFFVHRIQNTDPSMQ